MAWDFEVCQWATDSFGAPEAFEALTLACQQKKPGSPKKGLARPN
jgi:hypothetical protein